MIKNNLIENTNTNIAYLQSNINKLLLRCEYISDYIYIERAIGKVLIRDYADGSNNYELDISNAISVLNSRIYNDTVSGYINAVIIMGRNGKVIKFGMEADYFDINALCNSTWFSDHVIKHKMQWEGLVENPAKVIKQDYVLPIVRPVIFPDTYETIGWQLIAISPDIISEALKDFGVKKDEILIVHDQNYNCIFSTRNSLKGKNIYSIIMNEENQTEPIDYDGSKWLKFYNQSAYSGFTVVQLVDYEVFEAQSKILFGNTCLMLIMTITTAVFMTSFLSSNLTKPIKKISLKMKKITIGDFTRDKDLEGRDEIGILGKGINDLAENVDVLLYQIRKEEAQKKELEYKTLQSQINPHFVYNILNSVRIMAELQGADGISEMVTNFGELLKEVSKGILDKVTLEKEFELSERYIYLHKIRKKGLIRAEYDIDGSIRMCGILKFLLQPLLENAILHGLEGKKGMGFISIKARDMGNDISIEIWDNGIGMSKEDMNELLNQDVKKGVRYNKIGVKNVHERIQLVYGKSYGLTYESRIGEYTLVRLLLPKEFIA